MSNLRDVVAYICKNYPNENDLSNARVTKMVYLADWKSAIERREQLTDISWRFDHYGPFVYDVRDVAESDPAFRIVPTQNPFGSHKELLRVSEDVDYPSLSEDEMQVLDHVLETSAELNWDQFIKLVYSTYPIFTKERYSKLDLVQLAEEYGEVIPLLDA